jgi:hypothetical protein
LAPDQEGHGNQREQVGDEDDLKDVVTLGQPFDPRIGAGEDRKTDQRAGNAARDMIAGRMMGGGGGDGGTPGDGAGAGI